MITPTKTVLLHRRLTRLLGGDQHGAVEAQLERLRESYPGLRRPTLAGVATWQHAAKLLITFYTETSACFSAGEICRDIREARPDLRFSVFTLLGFVEAQDVRYLGQPAVTVARRTAGRTHSPVGSDALVYGPTEAEAMAHDFEVEIPLPGRSSGRLALAAGGM